MGTFFLYVRMYISMTVNGFVKLLYEKIPAMTKKKRKRKNHYRLPWNWFIGINFN